MTAKNIIIATGSVPFVPPGIPIDGKTVGKSPSQFVWTSPPASAVGCHVLDFPWKSKMQISHANFVQD